MEHGKLSINLYFYNLMTDERQRGSYEIVQSRDSAKRKATTKVALRSVPQVTLTYKQAMALFKASAVNPAGLYNMQMAITIWAIQPNKRSSASSRS
jgi:hypothetical protein